MCRKLLPSVCNIRFVLYLTIQGICVVPFVSTVLLVFLNVIINILVHSFILQDWWSDLLENNCKEVDYSGKMVLLLDILTMSSNVGDKALVFSQSLLTLDLIELYLSKLSRPGKKGKYWKRRKDWYRCVYLVFPLDGNYLIIIFLVSKYFIYQIAICTSSQKKETN